MGKILPVAGPKAFTNDEVIALCEKYSGLDAEMRNVPVWILKSTRNVLRSLQWARDAADRLVSLWGAGGEGSAHAATFSAACWGRVCLPG